eukprot:TRINITY_DN2755_c0_g1_i2.p1 TRINITY_DN2755_c0_g1~~TRINITY_DN2755_c0_g1_i2.p1  ORF type:complete len:235 (+),score=39.98 TRINITY_DN2755_c0_g1_i2:54-758(+)
MEAPAEVVQKVEELRQSIRQNAQEVIRSVMPAKIVQLTTLYNTAFATPVEEIRAEVLFPDSSDGAGAAAKPGKKRKLEQINKEGKEVEQKSNQKIKDIIGAIKKEVLQCIDALNTVKLWVQLNIPRIEDGNNFGVGIQEETISELTRSEDAGYNLLESMTKYYVTRAKLVTKVLKYPSIEDYRQSVDELDQKEYVNLRLSCLDMRNNMALCYDMLNKNIEKIITPRTSHSHALY